MHSASEKQAMWLGAGKMSAAWYDPQQDSTDQAFLWSCHKLCASSEDTKQEVPRDRSTAITQCSWRGASKLRGLLGRC